MSGQQSVRVVREADRGQHVTADRLPRLAFQQAGLRVAPPGGGVGPGVAALEVPPELLQNAEGVGVPAHRTALVYGVAEHQSPPGAVHHGGVDQAARDERGRQAAAVGQDIRQRPHRREHRCTLGVGPEVDHGGQHLQESGHGRVAGGQRGPPIVRIRVAGRWHYLGDQRQCGAQLGTGDDHLDRLPHLRNPRLLARPAPPIGIEQRRDRDRQPGGRPGQPGVLPGILPVRFLPRPAQHLRRHQQVQQLQRVIDRLGLQVPDRGHQRRQPPRVGVPADQRGGRGHPVAGQLGQPPRRYPRFGTQPGQTQHADLGHPIQELDQRRAAPARHRALAPPLQVRQP